VFCSESHKFNIDLSVNNWLCNTGWQCAHCYSGYWCFLCYRSVHIFGARFWLFILSILCCGPL